MALVIIGGGVIGLSTAYYASISNPGRKIYIIDSAPSLLLSASGYSGGFIAVDWFSASVTSLANLSFRLHQELADSNDGRRRWGYSASKAFSLVMDELDANGNKTGKQISGEDWLLQGISRAEAANTFSSVNSNKIATEHVQDSLLEKNGVPKWITQPEYGAIKSISSDNGCAQVQPKELCEWLIQQCKAKNVQIVLDTRPTGLISDKEGIFSAISLESNLSNEQRRTKSVLHCKDVVIAAGCWTPRVFETLFEKKMEIGINPLAGYSIVVRSPRYDRPIRETVSGKGQVDMCHSIFCAPSPDWKFAPEALGRMTKEGKPEIYIAGLNSSSMPLPEIASGMEKLKDKEQVAELKRVAALLAAKPTQGASSDELEIVQQGLCARPVSTSGIPIISKVKGINGGQNGGVYVAAGHGPWGITFALGTGLVVSEMLEGQSLSADISAMALSQDVSTVKSRL